MKKIILIILIHTLYTNINAQENLLGYVEYSGNFPSKRLNSKPVKSIVYFNNSESVSVDNKKSTVRTTTEKSKDEQSLSIQLPYGDDYGRQIYRNIKDSVVITRRPKNAISEPFIVKENWVNIKWDIKNKTKKIGNYKVIKAIGCFRGREYTAWFTYEIPVPFGPWKLHGLPGLILEAEDSEKMMRFYITEIKIPFDIKRNIKIPVSKNEITHKEEVYMSDNFDKLLAKKMNARLPKGSKMTPKPNNDGRKFKPEKTYEWETETVDEKKN